MPNTTETADPTYKSLRRSALEAALAPAVPMPAVDQVMTQIELPGRFMSLDREDRTCVIRGFHDTSIEVHVTDSEAFLRADGTMVVYADLIGRLEGHATWKSVSTFDLAIDASVEKRRRLLAQFETVARLSADGRLELRAHQRIKLEHPETSIVLRSGQAIPAQIKDLSRSGAAILATYAPRIDDTVTVGATRAKVVRHFDGGFAVQFFRMLPLEHFGTSFQL